MNHAINKAISDFVLRFAEENNRDPDSVIWLGDLIAKFLVSQEAQCLMPFSGLTTSKAERLALLVEEMGESLQAIGKICRHGYNSCHPDGGPTNQEQLEKELGDVRHAIIRLCASGDIRNSNIDFHAIKKAESVVKFLHHQPD